MILLAVGIIYHPVDVNAIAGIHGQNEREPPSAEVRARLDSVREQKQQTKQSNTDNIHRVTIKCGEKQANFDKKHSTCYQENALRNLTICQSHTYFELSLNNLWACSHSYYLKPGSYAV